MTQSGMTRQDRHYQGDNLTQQTCVARNSRCGKIVLLKVPVQSTVKGGILRVGAAKTAGKPKIIDPLGKALAWL